MSRVWLAACLTLCCVMCSCAVRPRDPFVAAERAMNHDDLLAALQAYDTVPVSHARYPDARAAAVEIECRMRRCHELILEALVLRGEWRDDEALDALRRARKQWAGQPSIELWIVATEQRRKLFAARAKGDKQPVGKSSTPSEPSPAAGSAKAPASIKPPTEPVASVEPRSAVLAPDKLASPILPVSSSSAPSSSSPELSPSLASPVVVVPVPVVVVRAEDAESVAPPSSTASVDAAAMLGAAPAGEVKSTVSLEANRPATVASLPVARLSVGEDPIALGLISVEGRLGRGEFRQAVDDLIELARRFPTDLRVCQRLAPLLRQRALLSYGDGALAAAIADWRRVLELQPDDQAVAQMLVRALAENGSAR